MSDGARDILNDLAAYLDQQAQAGVVGYFEEAMAEDSPLAGLEAPVAPVAPEAQPQPAAPQPQPQPKPAAPEDPRAAARREREEQFRRECAAFLRDALGQIARNRAHAVKPAAPVEPAQSGMFETGATTVPPAPETTTPEPVAPADKPAVLEAIAEQVRACTGCALHESRHMPVPGAGNPDAGLVLVGEAPGAEEDRQGIPFVGRSGHLLTDILKAIGMTRDDVFICNILKCRPPGNRDPERAEVNACEPYLQRQLEVIQPRVILCLGRIAAQTLLGTSAPLRTLRQSVHFYAGVPVMATYHPAALLRNPANKRDTWDDVRKVQALYNALGNVSST